LSHVEVEYQGLPYSRFLSRALAFDLLTLPLSGRQAFYNGRRGSVEACPLEGLVGQAQNQSAT